MLAQQTTASTAIADHLSEQTAQAVPRHVTNLDTRREEARHAGATNAVIELDVFASVKILIKQPDALEDFTAIGDRDALRRNIALDVAVDPRLRMMPQTGGPRQRHGTLKIRRTRNV